MTPFNMPNANLVLKAAPGSEDIVQDISAVRRVTPEGYQEIIVAFQMTPEERVHLLATGVLYISFLGRTIPPVQPMAYDPTLPQKGG